MLVVLFPRYLIVAVHQGHFGAPIQFIPLGLAKSWVFCYNATQFFHRDTPAGPWDQNHTKILMSCDEPSLLSTPASTGILITCIQTDHDSGSRFQLVPTIHKV